MEILSLVWQILENWWWLIVPAVLWFPAKTFYLWWMRWELWYPSFKWILLEIRPPKENLKPFSAMENIYSSLWGIIDSPNWRERWCEGELPLGGGLWFSSEIASFGGEIHFYMRIPSYFRATAESAIYAQYPDAEISLAEDYTKKVPQNIPNKDWDLYGEDFSLIRDDPYPIKTYPMFFEREVEEKRLMEEKRMDPLDSLLEKLSMLKSGEQIWLQIVTNPIKDQYIPWITRGKKLADKLAKRPEKPKPKPMIQEAAEILIAGPGEEEKPPEKSEVPLEFRLTPGEKEILSAVENKIKKYGYQTWIRVLHLYNVKEPHTPGFYKAIRAYFTQFMTGHLNGFIFYGPTRCRIHYWLPKRRLYLRKRIQFRRALDRLPPLWPRTMLGTPFCSFGHIQGREPGIRGTVVLNIEELATIFHLPAKIVPPGVPYVEAKKAAPPPGLAME